MAKPRGETAARAQLWSGALWASTVPKRRGERQPHSNRFKELFKVGTHTATGTVQITRIQALERYRELLWSQCFVIVSANCLFWAQEERRDENVFLGAADAKEDAVARNRIRKSYWASLERCPMRLRRCCFLLLS